MTLIHLEAAQCAGEAVLHQVTNWDAPTPCPGWTASDLAAHLSGDDRLIAAALDDAAPATPEPREPSVELHRRASRALAAAFARPGAAEKMINAPVGLVPGQLVLTLRTIEHVVHGWDIAMSQRLPTDSFVGLLGRDPQWTAAQWAPV